MAENLEEQIHSLLFAVRRSVRYHVHRRRFYEFLTVITPVLFLFAGSAAFALHFKPFLPWLEPVITGTAAIAAALNLAIGPAKKADLHALLARQFIGLEKEVIAVGMPDKEGLKRLTERRLDIELEEPPPKRLLDAICHIELLVAEGYTKKPPEVKAWRSAIKHIWSQDTYARELVNAVAASLSTPSNPASSPQA